MGAAVTDLIGAETVRTQLNVNEQSPEDLLLRCFFANVPNCEATRFA